jgi:O-6-methylguanine DNA methyltransferase
MSKFRNIVFEITARIPKGKVSTYGLIAQAAGLSSPRVVGNLLHSNKDPNKVPCHRVVNRLGHLAGKFGMGGSTVQAERLIADGVEVSSEGRVDLNKFLWTFEEAL